MSERNQKYHFDNREEPYHYIQRTIDSSWPPEGRDLSTYERELLFDKRELEGKVVLDLGAGLEAKFAKQLKEAGIKAEVISLSPDFIEEKYRTKSKESFPEGKFVAAIGQALPFKDESFDMIFAFYLIQHLTPGNFLRCAYEMARVLKKGGRAVIGPLIDNHDDDDDLLRGNPAYPYALFLSGDKKAMKKLKGYGVKVIQKSIPEENFRGGGHNIVFIKDDEKINNKNVAEKESKGHFFENHGIRMDSPSDQGIDLEKEDLKDEILDEMREFHKRGIEVPMVERDWDLVWVLSGPPIDIAEEFKEAKEVGQVIFALEDKIAKEDIKRKINESNTRLATGIKVAKEVTAKRLGKKIEELTLEDILNFGPDIYWNGTDWSNDNFRQRIDEGWVEKRYHFPRKKIVISGKLGIEHTGHQFEKFPK